jgi:hypothetical protein
MKPERCGNCPDIRNMTRDKATHNSKFPQFPKQANRENNDEKKGD